MQWSDVMGFLQRRKGLLDAVVFSGGEPTLQEGLRQAMTEVRGLGFKVGLHTGGAYPARLAELLPLSAWVGMDIKAAFTEYETVTATPGSGKKARDSAKLLLASGVPYEFRTTVHPLYHTEDSLLLLAEELQQMGAKHFVLQEFRPQGCADATVSATFSSRELLTDALCERLETMFERFAVRRA